MIKFEHPEVWGWEHAIRGMRNPLNSWERSDSYPAVDCGKCGIIDREGICYPKEHDCTPYKCYAIGDNDLSLMRRLIRAGSSHRKFLRQIFVSVDITAPRYWLAELDTYKVGTVANSCSTMHKIHSKPIELSDFSIDDFEIPDADIALKDCFINVVADCEMLRKAYLEALKKGQNDLAKQYWKGLIQLLPQSYNQKRTVTMTYENLLNMVSQRRGHKLDEWHDFCDWVFPLPYAEELLKEGLK
mgnify:CR=1 FL=1|jgi:hypothetical protein